MEHVSINADVSQLLVNRTVPLCMPDQVRVPSEYTARDSKLSVHRNAKHEIPPFRRIARKNISMFCVPNHPMVTNPWSEFERAAVGKLDGWLWPYFVGQPCCVRVRHNPRIE